MSRTPKTNLKFQFSIDWLDYHARYNADELAAVDVDTDRSFTYSQFNNRLKRLASGLKRHYGVNKGDRVAVVAHSSTDVFEMLFACWELGAALMPLNWRLSPHELKAIIEDGEPCVVIHDDEFAELLANIDLPKIERKLSPNDSAYEQLIAQSDADQEAVELTIDDLATLLYTSGTTGKPKGVMGTFRMMRDTIIHAAQHGELTGTSRSLTSAPLFHSAGLFGFSMPIFHYGGTLFVMRDWDPVKFLYLMADPEVGITHTIGVPMQYQMLAALQEFRLARFSTLRMAGVGAAPVPRALLDTWSRKGVHLAQSYGLTEAFSVAILPPHKAAARVGSAGHRMLHTRLRIFGPDNKELPAGEVGEIRIRGPAVTPGYWRNPQETERAFENGWFKTGDAGRMDEDGTVWIVDRYKEMYISGGENIYPAEVENALSQMPDVNMAAVVGVAHEKWGQVGFAAIHLNPGSQVTEQDIKDFCAERLARYKVPHHVRIVDALPISAQGKLLKKKVRELFEG